MPYNEKKKAYNRNYAKERMKRIPLDVLKEKYEEIKAAAEESGQSVNGYIKEAVEMRLAAKNKDN